MEIDFALLEIKVITWGSIFFDRLIQFFQSESSWEATGICIGWVNDLWSHRSFHFLVFFIKRNVSVNREIVT